MMSQAGFVRIHLLLKAARVFGLDTVVEFVFAGKSFAFFGVLRF